MYDHLKIKTKLGSGKKITYTYINMHTFNVYSATKHIS